MSMHLEKPYLSNIGSGRAPKLPQTKQLQAARLEHEKFLRKQGLHPDQLAARKPTKQRLAADSTVAKTTNIPSESVFEGAAGAVPTAQSPKVYSGQRRLLGIATMHKSNLVPVFADRSEDAQDIAHMRR